MKQLLIWDNLPTSLHTKYMQPTNLHLVPMSAIYLITNTPVYMAAFQSQRSLNLYASKHSLLSAIKLIKIVLSNAVYTIATDLLIIN